MPALCSRLIWLSCSAARSGCMSAKPIPSSPTKSRPLRRAFDANKPILGICLGAQMMAAALGARVAPGPVKEIGYAPLTLTAAGRSSVLAPLGASPVLHWHGDNCDCRRAANIWRRPRIVRCRHSAGRRRNLPCSFTLRPNPRDWKLGLSATPSNLAKRGSIRANCGRRREKLGPGAPRGRLQGAFGVARRGRGSSRMSFPDIGPDLKSKMPKLRGRLLSNQPLAELTWFRVGGPAQVLFMPEDEADLAICSRTFQARSQINVVGPRLQSDRARWRRSGRGSQTGSRLQRHRDRRP